MIGQGGTSFAGNLDSRKDMVRPCTGDDSLAASADWNSKVVRWFARRHLYLRCTVVMVCLVTLQGAGVGCAALDERVQKLTTEGQFDAALAELEKEGVGREIARKPEPTPAALRAREIYQGAVETDTGKQVSSALKAGMARQAQERAILGHNRCAWSDLLAQLEEECRNRVSAIDALTIQLEYSLGEAGSRDLRRTALKDAEPSVQFLRDSPDAMLAAARAREALRADVLDFLPSLSGTTPEVRDTFRSDLALSGIDGKLCDSAMTALDSLERLLASEAFELESLERLVGEMDALSKVDTLKAVVDHCRVRIDEWAGRRAQVPIDGARVDFALIASLNALRDEMAAAQRGGVDRLIIAAKVARAGTLLVDPACAPLAWAYLESAKAIDPTQPAVSAHMDHAVNALRAADSYRATIAIDIGPKIDPATHPLIFMTLYHAIGQATRAGVEWKWVDPVHENPSIRLEMAEGEMVVARFSDLSDKTSRYLSHYENVPNPRKAWLESRLSSLKFAIGMAESSFTSAVSSHNIYPTEWSLMSVNSARTRYVMAVDQYNAVVREYNMTPDTVSEPVYVSYTYREGKLRSGMTSSGYVHAGDNKRAVRHSEVASDNVRIGTKFNDINESSRRDDALEIDVDGEAQLRRLMAVAQRWVEDLGVVVSKVPPKTRVELDDTEMALVAWLSSPFGPTKRAAEDLKAPKWIRDVGLQFKYPARDSEWSPIELPAVPKPASEEELVKVALESSCEVRTSSSTGSTTARGSGALVSLDGLVLTCAHVLVGPRVTVRFVEGSLKGEYEAEVVRVNDRTDVALLRAKGVRAKSCLAIGTVEVERGAVVLAIGNPSVGEGAVAQAAMTRGAIVTPLGEDWGQPRVVADVAVASGSSGGPLIDVKQRCIVGVIAAISAPQFSEGQSSTGSFCLVAPATHLAEWLGIRVVE